MASIRQDDLRSYAVIGAEQRLLQIALEAANIFRVFPELRKRGFMSSGVAGGTSTTQSRSGRPVAGDGEMPKRRRRRMSAAARKRIGDAQRARWAKQKAANGVGTKKK